MLFLKKITLSAYLNFAKNYQFALQESSSVVKVKGSTHDFKSFQQTFNTHCHFLHLQFFFYLL